MILSIFTKLIETLVWNSDPIDRKSSNYMLPMLCGWADFDEGVSVIAEKPVDASEVSRRRINHISLNTYKDRVT